MTKDLDYIVFVIIINYYDKDSIGQLHCGLLYEHCHPYSCRLTHYGYCIIIIDSVYWQCFYKKKNLSPLGVLLHNLKKQQSYKELIVVRFVMEIVFLGDMSQNPP